MSTSNIISSLGAGSGIDISSLVTGLAEAERLPQQQRIDSRTESYQAQISGYGQLRSALDELKSSLTQLGSNDLFQARSVTVPNTDVITANSVDPGAQTGNYSIEVLEVASSQSLVMGSQADKTAALGKSGSMTINFGEWSYDDDDNPTGFALNADRAALTIDVEATDSLASIAEKINASDTGVQASVLKVDGDFQLMLSSPSGAANAMEISVTDSSLDDFAFNLANHASVTETQQAANAELKVNGLAVTRESNNIDDVIEGLDFTLNKAAPGESLSYAVTADKATAEEQIRAFVDAYNSFQETVGALVGYSRDDNNALVRGDLASDGSARLMVNRLQTMIGGSVPGVESGFSALTNIGIRTERDGSLSISESELSDAMTNNFELVEGLFATKTSSTNSAVSLNMGTYAASAQAGSYSVEITQDPSHGFLDADPITSVDFDAATDTFTTPLDTSGGGYSFQVKVDGVQSQLIELTGTYDSAEDLRKELQSRINGDENLREANVSLDVTYDSATDSFSFESNDYGSSSKVSFTAASASMADLGITTGLTGTAGTDVAGTIDGVAGFGAGNLLLPDLDSDLYGTNLEVEAGAAAQGAFEIGFSRGLAGELTNLIEGFLSSSGSIQMREDRLQAQLDELDDEQLSLDDRMERYTERLTSQFSVMEDIINSLQSTGDQLDGLVDRLPFTAAK